MTSDNQRDGNFPRILICGLGSIGRRHLRNLKTLGVQELMLLRSGKSTLPDDELEGIPVEHDLQAALKRWQPDAVVVSNPTSMHVDTAATALRQGCYVLLEKPISDALAAIQPLTTAAQKYPDRVLVGFQFRYHPGLARIKKLLQQGAIGRPLSVSAHWGEYLPGWHPWEDFRQSYSARRDLGGGVVNTLSHPIDYLRWLLGDVREVTAMLTADSTLDLEVEDTATLLLAFESGTHGVVHLNYNQRPPRHAFEVVGDLGTICWDNADGAVHWWSEQEPQWRRFDMDEQFERNDLFMAEARHFLAVIAGDEAPRCPLQDGIRALEITEAAHQSQRQGTRMTVHPQVWEQDGEA